MTASPCCGAPTHVDWVWAAVRVCSACGKPVEAAQLPAARPPLDLIAWLFPPEPGPRPAGEAVFVRYGRRIELLNSTAIRGRPDSWSWTGA